MRDQGFTTRGVTEAINEGTRTIMEEAVKCLEFQILAEQILVESAGAPNYMVLQEAVLDSVQQASLRFLQRCEQVSRAIIARLKEFGARLSGKIEDYITAVQPRVEAAKKHPGWENLHADIYPWNPVYVESGISNGIRRIHMAWNTRVVAEELTETIIRELKSHGDSAENYLNHLIESIEYDIENADSSTIDDAAQAFGVSAGDRDELMEAIALKAHGGAYEPGYTFGRDIDKIMATLINSSKLVDGVRQTYETHAKVLHDYANVLKANLAEANELLMSQEVSNPDVAATAIKLSQQGMVKITDHYESIMGKANAINISMIQQMCADYMRCVNMFVAYKGAQRTQQ